jgi:hypothetical protein
LSLVLALAVAIAVNHTHKSKHSPAAHEILSAQVQVPSPLHPLHLHLEVPAVVYGSATPNGKYARQSWHSGYGDEGLLLFSWIVRVPVLLEWGRLVVAMVLRPWSLFADGLEIM